MIGLRALKRLVDSRLSHAGNVYTDIGIPASGTFRNHECLLLNGLSRSSGFFFVVFLFVHTCVVPPQGLGCDESQSWSRLYSLSLLDIYITYQAEVTKEIDN